jgi:hypothetical protein
LSRDFGSSWRNPLKARSRSDVKNTPPAPSLKEIFESLDRDEAIHDAVLKWGYKLKEVSKHVGLHYSSVSRVAALTAESKKAKNKT